MAIIVDSNEQQQKDNQPIQSEVNSKSTIDNNLNKNINYNNKNLNSLCNSFSANDSSSLLTSVLIKSISNESNINNKPTMIRDQNKKRDQINESRSSECLKNNNDVNTSKSNLNFSISNILSKENNFMSNIRDNLLAASYPHYMAFGSPFHQSPKNSSAFDHLALQTTILSAHFLNNHSLVSSLSDQTKSQSFLPSMVFANNVPKKTFPWYPWSSLASSESSALSSIGSDSKSFNSNYNILSLNNSKEEPIAMLQKLHNFSGSSRRENSERSNSPSLVSSNPGSPQYTSNKYQLIQSDHEAEIDLEDDDEYNGSDTCSEKDSLANNHSITFKTDKDQLTISGLISKRKKKTRTVFTRSQVFQLESTFDMKRYLSSSERAGLAASLHLTETQNRRNKWKRQLAAELEAANMAQRIRTVPMLYHQPSDGQTSPAPKPGNLVSDASNSIQALTSYYYSNSGTFGQLVSSTSPHITTSSSSPSSNQILCSSAISGLV